jgi:hypothetical protein
MIFMYFPSTRLHAMTILNILHAAVLILVLLDIFKTPPSSTDVELSTPIYKPNPVISLLNPQVGTSQ